MRMGVSHEMTDPGMSVQSKVMRGELRKQTNGRRSHLSSSNLLGEQNRATPPKLTSREPRRDPNASAVDVVVSDMPTENDLAKFSAAPFSSATEPHPSKTHTSLFETEEVDDLTELDALWNDASTFFNAASDCSACSMYKASESSIRSSLSACSTYEASESSAKSSLSASSWKASRKQPHRRVSFEARGRTSREANCFTSREASGFTSHESSGKPRKQAAWIDGQVGHINVVDSEQIKHARIRI